MRQIKFRAWDTRTKEWCGGFCIEKGGLWKEGSNDSWVDLQHSEIIKLMQFTGLLDKNGKEIYEGDILRTGNLKRYNDKTDIAEVRWFRGGFMLHLNGNFGYRDIERYDNDSQLYKIIGNIYENPDLLSTSK